MYGSMWRFWSCELDYGIKIVLWSFLICVDFWSFVNKNPWIEWVLIFCFRWSFLILWCLWVGSSLVLLVVLHFFYLSRSCFFCDWSYLLLLLDVLIKNCVRSVTVLNLQVKMEDSLAISWSFLVLFWFGNMLPRFMELWWDFDSCEMKIRIQISSIFFDLAF